MHKDAPPSQQHPPASMTAWRAVSVYGRNAVLRAMAWDLRLNEDVSPAVSRELAEKNLREILETEDASHRWRPAWLGCMARRVRHEDPMHRDPERYR